MQMWPGFPSRAKFIEARVMEPQYRHPKVSIQVSTPTATPFVSHWWSVMCWHYLENFDPVQKKSWLTFVGGVVGGKGGMNPE